MSFISCGGHVVSGSLQVLISCRRESNHCCLKVSFNFIHWFMRFFANRRMNVKLDWWIQTIILSCQVTPLSKKLANDLLIFIIIIICNIATWKTSIIEDIIEHLIIFLDRRTHASRLLGGSSKPRGQQSQSTVQGSMPLNPVSSVSSSITNSNPTSEARVELSSAEGNHLEQFSTTSDYSGSTVVTIHDTPLSGNT